MAQPIYSKNEANNELARLQLQLSMLSRLQAADQLVVEVLINQALECLI